MSLSEDLLTWFDINRRTHLPWREDPSPYRVWISEIMLQQTRVETVIPYFERFMEVLPTVHDLAFVEDEILLKLWEGLGCYSRARNLKVAANQIVQDFEGIIPSTYEELIKLKGIGPYTAGAISSIAFQKNVIAADGNAYRIISRLFRYDGYLEDTSTKKTLEKYLKDLLPKNRPGDFNQALMDLGSSICIPNGVPNCRDCPINKYCEAFQCQDMLDFPKRKPKRQRKIQYFNVFIIEKDVEVLIEKREEKGVLNGMWGFPMMETKEAKSSNDEIEDFIENILDGGFNIEIKELTNAKHVFSHIEWRMRPYLVKLNNIKSENGNNKLHTQEYENIGKIVNDSSLNEHSLIEARDTVNQYDISNARFVDYKQLEDEISLPTAFRKLLIER